jgi:hypothetical protein
LLLARRAKVTKPFRSGRKTCHVEKGLKEIKMIALTGEANLWQKFSSLELEMLKSGCIEDQRIQCKRPTKAKIEI